MKKIGESLKGVLGGFILILVGVILLWWNEGNNVRNLKTTKEMGSSYIDVASDKVDEKNEGKLIATHGELIYEEELKDDDFEISVKTPLLKRIVEVYQWEETSSTDEDGKTTYSYKKVWSSDLIDSSNFDKSGHENPTVKKYEDEVYISSLVKVGAFKLTADQVSTLKTDASYSNFNEEVLTSLELKKEGIYITNADNINNPEIGDYRISFVYNDSKEVSVLAVQTGETFKDFVSKQGVSINRVMDGIHDGKDMINVIKQENNYLKWILRLCGSLAIIFGILTILKPITTVSGFVPILGGIVSSAVGIVSFIIGLAISFVVIAIAWIRFRPIVGICLLVAVVALIVLLLKIKKDKHANVTPQNTQTTNTDYVVPNTNNNEINQNNEENKN